MNGGLSECRNESRIGQNPASRVLAAAAVTAVAHDDTVRIGWCRTRRFVVFEKAAVGRDEIGLLLVALADVAEASAVDV